MEIPPAIFDFDIAAFGPAEFVEAVLEAGSP